MAIAICPSCGDDIKLSGRLKIGSEVICPRCDAELEVIDLDPIELDWAYLDDGGWDDWEDDEEDDYY
jgi:lysine biosynthesis protein LysW